MREGGSLPGLMECDDEGLYVVKFRGAGQGALALTAEIFVGSLARAVGLPVPEIVIVDVDKNLAAAEADPDIQDLLRASAGWNVGVDFLPGAFPFALPIDPLLAADIVWFDALTTNVDRTAKNPNLLRWHNRVWMIDHGAALIAQHNDKPLADAAVLPFPRIQTHLLLPVAGSIADAHTRLMPRLERRVVESAAREVPDDWFTNHPREDYVEHVLRRAKDGGFVKEADDERP